MQGKEGEEVFDNCICIVLYLSRYCSVFVIFCICIILHLYCLCFYCICICRRVEVPQREAGEEATANCLQWSVLSIRGCYQDKHDVDDEDDEDEDEDVVNLIVRMSRMSTEG